MYEASLTKTKHYMLYSLPYNKKVFNLMIKAETCSCRGKLWKKKTPLSNTNIKSCVLTVLYPYYDHISTLSYIFITPCLVKHSYCRSSHAILGQCSIFRHNCSQIFLRRYMVMASKISFYTPNPLRWSEAF